MFRIKGERKGEIMAIINLAPDAVLESTGWSSGTITSVQDPDPSLPDGDWYVPNTNADAVLRVSFPTPTQPSTLTITTNSQTFNVRVRATGATATAKAQIQLYKNGVLVSSGTDTTITSTVANGVNLAYTWTPTADDDGSSIECRVVISGDTSGSGTSRGSVSIGAIQWVANYTPIVVLPVDSVKMNVPTDLFPFNTSAWRRPEVKAKISTTDGTPAKLVVEHGTSPTLSGATTTTSTSVASGTVVTLSLGTYTSGVEIYWRVHISNDVVTSNKTAIYSYTYKPSGTFSPDGTAFMQQADDAIHGRLIDVSSYQGVIDWVAVKNSGVNYAYLRCWGADRSANGDTNFETFVANSKLAGVKTGGYFFCMPSVPLDLAQARQEADRFIAKLQAGYGTGKYGDLVPMLDLEDNTGTQWTTIGQEITNLSVSNMLLWANEFRNYFEAQTGRTLGLYTTDYFCRDLRNNFNHNDATGLPVAGTSGNILSDMPLWVSGFASYDRYKGRVMPSCGGWTKWHVLQYGDTNLTPQYFQVSGIEKPPTDLNATEPIEWVMPPNAPVGATATSSGVGSVNITWNPSSEIDVNKWEIYVNGVLQTTSTTEGSASLTGLTAGTKTIEIRPIDDFGDKPVTTTTVSYVVAGASGIAPKVTIVSVSKLKISDEPEFDRANITFKFDIDTKLFTVNVNGVDYDTGLVAHSGGGKSVSNLSSMLVSDLATQTVQQISIIVAGVEIVAEVDYSELSNGDNRINIYGQATDGTWSAYETDPTKEYSNNESSGSGDPPSDTTAPNNITDLRDDYVDSESIGLSWTNSTSVDISHYDIYIKTSGAYQWMFDGQSTFNYYTIFGLTQLTTYEIKIVSVDTSGNESSGTTMTVSTSSVR
jgi:lysozyme